jgi:methionyl aminopeptidase
LIILKSSGELESMKRAGSLVAKTIAVLKDAVRPGITTAELDGLAEDVIRNHGGIPAFKGYHGFPGSICTSVNEQVVHGIPSIRKLKNGDIISIDTGSIIEGFYGDAAVTLPVGEISDEAKRLLIVTEGSLMAGIEQAKAGNRLSDISNAVQTFVEGNGFSIVRDYVGHGIGRSMHEDPQIPNYGPPGRGPRLEPGMVLAIEPMVNAGGYRVETLEDNWTVVTADRSLSAHFEHTVAVTENGPVILTCL